MMRRSGKAAWNAFASAVVCGVVTSCAGGSPATATPQPISVWTMTPVVQVMSRCPEPEARPAAETSILVPGPGPGVPASTAEGERLILAVTVLGVGCQPIADASVDVWHTDAAGVYGPGHGTSELQCCYYQGTIRTDENGRFELRTIKPGAYQGEALPPPAHIHIDIRHPEAEGLMTEILFADDPALPPDAGLGGSVVAELAWVEDAQGGYWSGAVTIVLGSS